MNKHFSILLTFLFSIYALAIAQKGNEYTLVVEGFDWSAAANKVILPMGKNISTVDYKAFEVSVSRYTECAELKHNQAFGKRTVIHAYVSDSEGNKQAKDQFATLVLSISPSDILDAPMQYFNNEKCSGNQWIDYQLVITNKSNQKIWNKENRRLLPLVKEFDLTGKFKYNEQLSMSYASYQPKTENKKSPLIIWLHGGGEGGFDPTIPLLANRAVNYASKEIQTHFGGAYVLVPQCPGAWMHNEKGISTWGKENDVYNQGLMALIKDFVKQHPDIDGDRIYVGGCSNGGYMSLKLLILFPDYFAAAFPSAIAYKSEYISDAQIASIKDIPMWFIQSKDDPVTRRDETVLPIYQRLIKAGAKNVHFSDYDHVIDLTNLYGGKDYHYLGHFSWIYSHANTARLDFDGKPVRVEGKAVTIMEWMAVQRK